MEYCLPSSYLVAFLWGLAVIAGMIGLGRLAGRLVDPVTSASAGWGLHAIWGMTVYLFLGAILAVFHWCNARAITLLIGAGLLALLWMTVRNWRGQWSALMAAPWKMWPAFAIAALLYAGGIVFWPHGNPCDDWPCYFYFCEKLLSTGSFDEPFAWRRMASLGGHTLLQSSVLAQTSFGSARAFELALGPVILLGLVCGFRRGVLTKSLLGLVIALIALTTRMIRLNSASQMTGVVLFLGLFVTLNLIDGLGNEDPRRRLRWLGVAGFVAASASSLRAQYIPAAVAALGIFWLGCWIRDRQPRHVMVNELAVLGGAMLLGLLPWMIMSYRSNDTPLFPVFQAGNRLDFNPSDLHASLATRAALPMKMVLHPEILPLFLCLLALPPWRQALAARAVAIAMVITSLVVGFGLALAPDEDTIPRYVQPMVLAGALAALMAAAAAPRARLHAWAVSILWIAVSLPLRSDFTWQSFSYLQELGEANMPYTAQDFIDHLHAQALVPPGKRILVASDYPLFLDQRRNPIWIVDMPFADSPPPGMPFRKGPEEMKRYLQGLGIDYVLCMDFGKSAQLYSRPVWEEQSHSRISIVKAQSVFYLDFFNTMDRLLASETIAGRVGDLTVLKLSP
jgi:hypothetical protein